MPEARKFQLRSHPAVDLQCIHRSLSSFHLFSKDWATLAQSEPCSVCLSSDVAPLILHWVSWLWISLFSSSAAVYVLMVAYPGATIKVGHMGSRQISVSLF